MMAVHNLTRGKGLDLILHTPGGSIGATQSIVNYLHAMFGDNIRAIVPQIAMSAGTMVACSCSNIVMAHHSNLGPIDPQIGGRPAYGIIHEFQEALKQIKKDPDSIHIWRPILAQYKPTLLTECENAIDWSNKFVKKQLQERMFREDNKKIAAKKAEKIMKPLTDYKKNGSHGRHIHYDECKKMGLNVSLLEDDNEFQDIVLTIHHCYMHSLMNTPTFKLIENHIGATFAKQQLVVMQQVQQGR